MAQATYFNKGLVKGKLIKSEIISWEKEGKKGEFLSMEIEAGYSNRIKATMFPTKSNPSKHKEVHEAYPVGSEIEVSGNVNEREYDANGKKGIDRSVSAFSVKSLKEGTEPNATFIIQGIVENIRELNDTMVVKVRIDESYEKDGTVVEKDPVYFTLQGDVAEQIDDYNVEKGCNAKFKGKIFNKLELDDYGDITGNIQMFQIEIIEEKSVIPADELNDEELPF